MIPRVYTYLNTGPQTGPQAPVGLDPLTNPFSVTVGVSFDPILGGCTYGIEFTLDDITRIDPSAATWWPDPTLPPGTFVPGITFYNNPVWAIRLNMDNLISPGVKLYVLQAMSPR
jgi:hypothetical protein